MKKIYFKNFKGFEENLVELEDVNFLVGENSSGKTSLINLINLLSNPEFWFNNQFNFGEVDLGSFEEIISKQSKDHFFQIGTEVTHDSENQVKIRADRILIQFKSQKSIPQIEWVRFSFNNINVHVKGVSRKLSGYYFIGEFQSYTDWLLKFNSEGIKLDTELPSFKLPIPLLFQIIVNTIVNKSEKPNEKKREKIEFTDAILFQRYTWLAPIRAKAKRIYESHNVKFSPEGEHIPSLLKSLFSQSKKREKTKAVLEKFGMESNLFDTLEIKEFGDNNASPFEIVVKYENIPIKLPNVGYGVSQILPIIIEMLASKRTMFSIQQPEVHLHAKAQAAFGSFLFKTCQNEENSFIIETHSDFTINRFRYSLSKHQTKRPISSQVLFFERKPQGNTITTLKIDSNGAYINPPPDGYRNFFIDEELKLLEL